MLEKNDLSYVSAKDTLVRRVFGLGPCFFLLGILTFLRYSSALDFSLVFGLGLSAVLLAGANWW